MTDQTVTEMSCTEANQIHRRDWRETWKIMGVLTAIVLFALAVRSAVAQPGPIEAAPQHSPPTRAIELTEGNRALVSLRLATVVPEMQVVQLLIKTGWAMSLDWGHKIEFAENYADCCLEVYADGTICNLTNQRVPVTIDDEEWFVEPRGVLLVVPRGVEILCSNTCDAGRRALCNIIDGQCIVECVDCPPQGSTPCKHSCIVFLDPEDPPIQPAEGTNAEVVDDP